MVIKMENKMSVDLLKKIGEISQIAGIRKIKFTSGKASGTEAYEVYNASGLRFTVLADLCLDILDFKYKGLNIGFTTKNGLVGNKFFNALDNEFSYYWRAGMLYTCGLANAGPPCDDKGLYRTEHGRIGMLPAENLSISTSWVDGDYYLEISGQMRETMVYGSNLALKRSIFTSLDSKEIFIKDIVENFEPGKEEFMLLYHFNFGYPLVDESTIILKPKGLITPRTPSATSGVDKCLEMEPPEDDREEECFFHENKPDKDGWSYVGVVNRKLGICAYLKYKYKNLPVLVQWKSARSHDYTIGIEPSNSFIMGRVEERKNGTLPMIPGYSEIEHNICLGILDNEKDISEFEKKLGDI